jgi:hypothetical protein
MLTLSFLFSLRQLFQHSVPGLVAPLRNKSRARFLFGATLLSSFFLYSTLGVTCALYFGYSTNASINLNWTNFTWGKGQAQINVTGNQTKRANRLAITHARHVSLLCSVLAFFLVSQLSHRSLPCL